MRHLDLFSGIGGFALAASWVWCNEHEIVSFCEIDPFCRKVLAKHWPDVSCHDDIKTMNGGDLGRIDLLTGGFPCQPYSIAGKRRGAKDDRALWPEMLRIVKEARPNWVIGENVVGFASMELDNCLSDMESEGYETTAFIIPAFAVDARHPRERCFVVAHTNSVEFKGVQQEHGLFFVENKSCTHTACCPWPLRRGNGVRFLWQGEPYVDRVADGIPNRVDRIKSLGNSIVPQAVVPIMKAIKEIEACHP